MKISDAKLTIFNSAFIQGVNVNPRLKRIAQLGLFLMLGASMNAEAGLFGFGGTSWKEEVLLHDGSKIVVERSVERGGRHEIGQEPPIKVQSLNFILPGTNENVTWEDKFTEDVGGANFLPMQLEILKDTAYLVVYPMGCLSYNKWGRPNPPYVVFKYQGKAWNRIALKELPMEFKISNLIFSSPDSEAKKTRQRIISAETIKALYAGYKQPEFKTILREPVTGGDATNPNNIVISFAGTDGSAGGILTNPDKQADAALGAGLWSDQLGQAAAYYLEIKASAPANATIN